MSLSADADRRTAVRALDARWWGKKGAMRIKFGLLFGFALGYYFGTAAGKERHEQLNQFLATVTNSGPANMASDRAKSAADSGYHRAKNKVVHKLHHNGNGIDDTADFSPS
jgi:hypothetical protein